MEKAKEAENKFQNQSFTAHEVKRIFKFAVKSREDRKNGNNNMDIGRVKLSAALESHIDKKEKYKYPELLDLFSNKNLAQEDLNYGIGRINKWG